MDSVRGVKGEDEVDAPSRHRPQAECRRWLVRWRLYKSSRWSLIDLVHMATCGWGTCVVCPITFNMLLNPQLWIFGNVCSFEPSEFSSTVKLGYTVEYWIHQKQPVEFVIFHMAQPPYRHIRGLLLSRTVNIWLVVQQYAHDVVDMLYLPLQKVTYYYSAEVVHRRCAQWFYKCMYIHIH